MQIILNKESSRTNSRRQSHLPAAVVPVLYLLQGKTTWKSEFMFISSHYPISPRSHFVNATKHYHYRTESDIIMIVIFLKNLYSVHIFYAKFINIAFYFPTFVTLDLPIPFHAYIVAMLMLYDHTKCHMRNSNGSLIAAVKLTDHDFRTAPFCSFTVWKNYPGKYLIYFNYVTKHHLVMCCFHLWISHVRFITDCKKLKIQCYGGL
jgi:hypothetical protein